jgi:putative transcriptional regulator
MPVSHHLDDITVTAYATGSLPRELLIVAECHLEFCSRCRAELNAARQIGGALLGELERSSVSSDCKASVMNRIGSATVHRLGLAKPLRSSGLPLALERVVKFDDLDEVPWRRAGPGIQMFKLPRFEGETGFFGLLKIAPGAKVPTHSHGGTELTLVLKGAYQDALGHFGRGDIADHDESVEHQPTVVGNEACICLAANDAATRFRSLPARFLQRFVGI